MTTIKVIMSAEQKVKLSKTVEMSVEDYQAYLQLIEERGFGKEGKINRIAERYGLNDIGSEYDWGDLEETMFEVAP